MKSPRAAAAAAAATQVKVTGEENDKNVRALNSQEGQKREREMKGGGAGTEEGREKRESL